MMQKGKKIVFVTHPPVYHTRLDHLPMGHRGNKSTRKFIEEAQPDLVLCGHFHENEKKQDKIKKTLTKIVRKSPSEENRNVFNTRR